MKRIGIFFALFSLPALADPSVCIVGPPAKEADRYLPDRPCLEKDATKYIEQIRAAKALYPEFVKKLLESVKRIEIEEEFFGPAWSTPVDEKSPSEILIGLRKLELDEKIGIERYLTDFEQQSFGGHAGPRVRISPPARAELPPITFLLLHELGHALDYERGIEKSWASLHNSGISALSGICINQCKGKYLAPQEAPELYKYLFKSGFPSQLASINPREDFAESFAYFVLTERLGTEITIETPSKFSIRTLLEESPNFAKKRNFLENWTVLKQQTETSNANGKTIQR